MKSPEPSVRPSGFYDVLFGKTNKDQAIKPEEQSALAQLLALT